ncbi:DNA polymerase beta domain-containing protein region [groundwater metagenome]
MKTLLDNKQITNKFRQKLLEQFKDDLISLVLFGSVARGTARKESDIDILIILKDAPDSYYERLKPVIDIELELRNDIEGMPPVFSSIILSMDEAKENRNIFLDMIDDSIILYDKNSFFKNRLSELKNRLIQLGSKKVILDDDTWYWNLKPDMEAGEVIEL